MTSEDLFTAAQRTEKQVKEPSKQESKPLSNVPEMSVSDLALGLKKTLEETYGRVRIRGELTGIKIAASGHLYGDIKDENAVINIVCWRGSLSKLAIKPEDGMDVVITGRVSSYPKSSRYQIIIDSLELAGEGALLKLLEERRKALAAEGLFDPVKKKQLPFLPNRIGVVTSPTGAVIRDIMHRLGDRFPRHVLLWPAVVQGDNAAAQIVAGINGLNQLPDNKKPDVIIVARGGGSLEDLMAFNEESVVRAVAASSLPIISAVGHETDTTLIDYAADLRAPTPTGAAEMVVPVRLNLIAQIQEYNERLVRSATRLINDKSNILSAQTAKLRDPKRLLESKEQTLDLLSEKLAGGLRENIQSKHVQYQKIQSRLTSPKFLIKEKTQIVIHLAKQLEQTMPRILNDQKNKIDTATRMLDSLSPKGVLSRGYALIYDKAGKIVRKSEAVSNNDNLTIEFENNDKLAVKADKS